MKAALLLSFLGLLSLVGAAPQEVTDSLMVEDLEDSSNEIPEGKVQEDTAHLSTLADVWDQTLADIVALEKIFLQWGASGSGSERQYFYTIEAASRDMAKQVTLIELAGRSRLYVYRDFAVLENHLGEELGVLEFSDLEGNDNKIEDLRTSNTAGNPSTLRRLVRYGKHDKDPYRTEGTFFDGYCRYGCSQMGVTFPHYYRPFFGYGYPLVGTEGFFPAGYGGNPVTELAANGVMAGVGGPGVGAASIGGAPAIGTYGGANGGTYGGTYGGSQSYVGAGPGMPQGMGTGGSPILRP